MACRIDYKIRNWWNSWQESWYTTETDPNVALVGAAKMVAVRSVMFGIGTYIYQVRTVNLARKNSTATYFPPQPVILLNQLPAGIPSDTAWNAVQARVGAQLAGVFYHRTMWLRGVPDNWIVFDMNGDPVFPNVIQTSLDNFFNKMSQAGGYQLYLQSVTKVAAANPKVPVTSIGVSADSPPLIVLSAAGTGYSTGQVVLVSGCRGNNLQQNRPGRKGVNGKWTVVRSDATTVTIALPASYLPGVPLLFKNGRVRSNNIVYPPVSSISAIGYTSRLTHGALPGQRGSKPRRGPSIP